MTDNHVLVIAGGPLRTMERNDLPAHSLVVAADSGADSARALGLRVHIAVGDFDSITEEEVARLRSEGTELRRFPPQKDATDLELALDVALENGATHVTVVGGDSGRLDHLLGNITLLANERYASVQVDALFDSARLKIVRDSAQFDSSEGRLLSLFAIGATAHGVSTRGLLYALDNATLQPNSVLGVSNEIEGSEASMSLRSGVIVAIQPGTVFDPAS